MKEHPTLQEWKTILEEITKMNSYYQTQTGIPNTPRYQPNILVGGHLGHSGISAATKTY